MNGARQSRDAAQARWEAGGGPGLTEQGADDAGRALVAPLEAVHDGGEHHRVQPDRAAARKRRRQRGGRGGRRRGLRRGSLSGRRSSDRRGCGSGRGSRGRGRPRNSLSRANRGSRHLVGKRKREVP